jgi:hypothetical protein
VGTLGNGGLPLCKVAFVGNLPGGYFCHGDCLAGLVGPTLGSKGRLLGFLSRFAPFLGHVVRKPPSVLGDSTGAVLGLTDGRGSLGFHSLDLRVSLTEHNLQLLPV